MFRLGGSEDMKANEFKIMEDCIERGFDGGYQKAFKHTDDPSEDQIKEQVLHYIMLEICEYFKFEEDKDE